METPTNPIAARNHERKLTEALAIIAKVCPGWDKPELLTAVSEWIAYRNERRLPEWKKITWEKNLRIFRPLGYAILIEAIDTSIANSWMGLFTSRYVKKPEPHVSPETTIQIEAERDWRAIEHWAFTVWGSSPPPRLSRPSLAAIAQMGGWATLQRDYKSDRALGKERFLHERAATPSV